MNQNTKQGFEFQLILIQYLNHAVFNCLGPVENILPSFAFHEINVINNIQMSAL